MLRSADRRRVARSVALQSLFAADVRRVLDGTRPSDEPAPGYEWMDECVEERALEFADRLYQGVFEHQNNIDSVIGQYAPAWPVKQLSVVDRNILRIAIFELLHTPATPPKAAIDEAVELAKTFGSNSSSRFVNGVLGAFMANAVCRDVVVSGTPPDGR